MDEQQTGVPAEPMSVTAEAAAGLHELFLTYVAAGFTEAQALFLLAQIIRPQT